MQGRHTEAGCEAPAVRASHTACQHALKVLWPSTQDSLAPLLLHGMLARQPSPGGSWATAPHLHHGPHMHGADVGGHVVEEQVGVQHAQRPVAGLHRRQQAAGARRAERWVKGGVWGVTLVGMTVHFACVTQRRTACAKLPLLQLSG